MVGSPPRGPDALRSHADPGGTMVGALVVLVLAGLVVPIALILTAVVFDVAFLAWMLARAIGHRFAPAAIARWSHWHVAHRGPTTV